MGEITATPIPITGLTRSKVDTTIALHFTSGLRATKIGNEWQIGPLLREHGVSSLTGIPEGEVCGLGGAMGPVLFGIDEIVPVDPYLPARLWRPLLGLPEGAHLPSDSWGMIASSSRQAGDDSYANVARNLSVSLWAAGLQLRNASDEYHKQLFAALASGRKVGARFSNMRVIDLQLALHAALVDMSSARDYLAQVAARRVNAPSKIDALSRLVGWLKKPANAAAKRDVLVAHLLAASDPTTTDPWLADITDYRNLFVHREHIGAGKAANRLVLQERQSPVGAVRTITMPMQIRPGAQVTRDALTRFFDLYRKLCGLAVWSKNWNGEKACGS